jgi:hypothetical protein
LKLYRAYDLLGFGCAESFDRMQLWQDTIEEIHTALKNHKADTQKGNRRKPENTIFKAKYLNLSKLVLPLSRDIGCNYVMVKAPPHWVLSSKQILRTTFLCLVQRWAIALCPCRTDTISRVITAPKIVLLSRNFYSL